MSSSVKESGIVFTFAQQPIFTDRGENRVDNYKTVDFIFSFPDSVYFVEVKNYHAVRGKKLERAINPPERAWPLVDKLIYKFRDTYLWSYVGGKFRDSMKKRKIVYIALIANLPSRDYSQLHKIVKRRLPLVKNQKLTPAFCDDFFLVDLNNWNTLFKDKLGAARYPKNCD